MVRSRPWVNRLVLFVLRSPARRLLSARLCELSYRAPSDGRVICLPVQYATHGAELIVVAAHAPEKRWWRAFIHARPVTIGQAGRIWFGLARTIHPDHPSSQTVRQIYERRHHVRLSSADRIVLIDPIAPISTFTRGEQPFGTYGPAVARYRERLSVRRDIGGTS